MYYAEAAQHTCIKYPNKNTKTTQNITAKYYTKRCRCTRYANIYTTCKTQKHGNVIRVHLSLKCCITTLPDL